MVKKLLEVLKERAELSLGKPARAGHRLGEQHKAKLFSAAVTQ